MPPEQRGVRGIVCVILILGSFNELVRSTSYFAVQW